MKITNKEGVELHKINIITICPIEFATEARKICADYLSNGELPEVMLNKNIGSNGVITHCFCERIAWNDEELKQTKYMSELNLPWVTGDFDINKLSIIVKNPGEDILSELNLEVI